MKHRHGDLRVHATALRFARLWIRECFWFNLASEFDSYEGRAYFPGDIPDHVGLSGIRRPS